MKSKFKNQKSPPKADPPRAEKVKTKSGPARNVLILNRTGDWLRPSALKLRSSTPRSFKLEELEEMVSEVELR